MKKVAAISLLIFLLSGCGGTSQSPSPAASRSIIIQFDITKCGGKTLEIKNTDPAGQTLKLLKGMHVLGKDGKSVSEVAGDVNIAPNETKTVELTKELQINNEYFLGYSDTNPVPAYKKYFQCK